MSVLLFCTTLDLKNFEIVLGFNKSKPPQCCNEFLIKRQNVEDPV